MPVSKVLRFQVLRRDGHRCRYCGRGVEDGVKLTVDHVVPGTLGGSDAPENLAAACSDCNSGKSSSAPGADLVADVAADALRWKVAMQYAADVWRSRQDELDGYVAAFEGQWNRWQTDTGPIALDGEHIEGLHALHRAGFPAGMLQHAVDVAMRARVRGDVLRYFFGVAWRLTRELQDEARAFVAADTPGRR